MEIALCYFMCSIPIAVVLVGFMGLVFLYLKGKPPNLHIYESEKYFCDPKSGLKTLFPSLEEHSSLNLSVIVPAYNEEERLPVMMKETMEYLIQRKENDKTFTFEVLIVDDGSKDKTTKTALGYSEKYGTDKVRVLTLEKNRGKGGAIRVGMLSARGDLLLFADADGASKFSHIEKLEKEICDVKDKNGMGIVCGSRAHLEKDAIAQRSLFRTILMKGFHFLVWFLCVKNIRDTQCGFKLLTRNAARLVFRNMHVEQWAFDVDMLHIAQCYDIPIGEVAIAWQEIEGSKVTPFWSWLQMGRDLLVIRLNYLLGAWRMDHHVKAA